MNPNVNATLDLDVDERAFRAPIRSSHLFDGREVEVNRDGGVEVQVQVDVDIKVNVARNPHVGA